MSKRIVIVGGVAAGASAAAKARRTSEEVEIVLLEAGPYMSFANCGLPYYVGGEIDSRAKLFVVQAEEFARRFNVDVRLGVRAESVCPAEHEVTVSTADGGTETLSFSRLILATGTTPIRPPIEGIDRPDVFYCRTVPDVDAIVDRLAAVPSVRPGRAMIIGGGYIGLECAEQLLRRGLRVTVVELLDQLMGPLDPEMARPVQATLTAAGAEVILSDGVAKISQAGDGDGAVAVTQAGREIPFDLAIVGAGVRPNVALAESAGLALGVTGAIIVDERQQTSEPAIYAAGDNCEATFLPTGSAVNVPLAGPANRMGRVAGTNAALDLHDATDDDVRRLRFGGVLGTAIVGVCGTVAGGTGLAEKAAAAAGVDVATAYLPGSSHAGYYPGAEKMLVKVVYDPADGRILGGQAVGGDGVDKRLDVLAAAIYARQTVADLEQLDLCYAPPFGSAKDVANLAGYAAANAVRGTSPGLSPAALLAELDGETPPLVIDVRLPAEHVAGHMDGSVNIPVDDLRDRLDEVPADRPVVVHCAVGYRSYVAQQILLNRGWTDVRNLYGGYGLLAQELKAAGRS